LRVDFGPGYRVYLGKETHVLVVLLCDGDKKTQERDIKKAKKLWDDYRSRDDDEE
jgi:putative addiction module killer protein